MTDLKCFQMTNLCPQRGWGEREEACLISRSLSCRCTWYIHVFSQTAASVSQRWLLGLPLREVTCRRPAGLEHLDRACLLWGFKNSYEGNVYYFTDRVPKIMMLILCSSQENKIQKVSLILVFKAKSKSLLPQWIPKKTVTENYTDNSVGKAFL